MTGEKTIPILPCRCIDEVADFYRMLGFECTHRQTKPNPYLALQREDLELHFFGMPEFAPEQSYGNCVVHVPDTGVLYEAFSAGMRAAHGKLLIAGVPRMTRPRRRKNTGRLSGFNVIDPGGNWIRIIQDPGVPADRPEDRPKSKLEVVLENAVVLGDSKGDLSRAARILDSHLLKATGPPVDLVQAVIYRAELAIRLGDDRLAAELLARARSTELTGAEREQLAETLSYADDLDRVLR